MPLALRLSGALDADALQTALSAIVERHEILRTNFESVDGRPRQVVRPPASVPVPVTDLSHLDGAIAIERALEAVAEAAARSFDLGPRPLVRARLFRLDDTTHYLLVTFHHIVADGWSLGVFLRELTALYQGPWRPGTSAPRRPGLARTLPALPVQYADFAAWQQAWLARGGGDADIAFWRRQLAGAPPALELPLDHPRPAAQSFRGEACHRVVDAAVTRRLRALGRAEQATLFMTLVSAFAAVLSRLSGQDDVCVGVPVAGRGRAETEHLIGAFLNTVVLRTRLDPAATFHDLVGRVRAATLEAFAHDALPFERVVEALVPERDLSRTPLFQVVFNMLNFGISDAVELADLRIEPAPLPASLQAASKFDLTMYAAEAGGELHLRAVYDASLFNRPRIEALLGVYEQVLARASANPAVRVMDLDLMAPESRAALPDPAAPLVEAPPGPSIAARLREIAAAAPDRVAVEDAAGAMTYAELDRASDRLAGRLVAAGIGAGDVVAVYAHRSRALVVSMMAVLKSGGAFCLLDPAQPAERLVRCVSAAAPVACLHLTAAGDMPDALVTAIGTTARVVLPVEDRVGGGDESAPSAELSENPDRLIYVACTSGTTGDLKAVAGTARPVRHFLMWHSATFGLSSSDRFSMLSGLAHDPLLRDVLTPLWVGGTLVIPAPEVIRQPRELADWFRRARVTTAHATPQHARLLTAGAVELGETFPDLRHVFFAGDVLTDHVVADVRHAAPVATLVNFYGATETPQAMAWFPVPPPPGGAGEPAGASIPIGRGIEGVQLLVVNAAGRLCGVGEPGEIWIRTPYLALGYLNDPDLTSARFLKNPFGSAPGDRTYRTGDVGRYRADGTVEFAGRRDLQVKIRGFRVEIEEVEHVLARHAAVASVAVVTRPDAAGELELVACFVPRASAPPPPADALRALAASRLPDYAVPGRFEQLEVMPLSPNGKIDRAALRRPAGVELRTAAPVAPRTETERRVASIWAEVLRTGEVGVRDNFFERGGHSLLATQVVSRIRTICGVELPLRRLFEAPTVEGLAAAVDALAGETGAAAAPPMVPVARGGALPLSFSQERMWFLNQLMPESIAYNIAIASRLRGPIDLAAFARAFEVLARRHESLRTTFRFADKAPTQVIAAEPHNPFSFTDVSAIPVEAALAEARRLAEAAARVPFDLTNGPLMRVSAYRVAPDDHVVMLNMHHIISDQWSAGVLGREIGVIYEALTRGAEPELPALPIQYPDFASWQRRWLDGDRLREQLDYWTARLTGAPPLELPTDRPRPSFQAGRGSRRLIAFPQDLVESVRALTVAENSTPFMALLAAFKLLLWRYSGQDDLTVGVPIANRTRQEVEGQIGTFVNTLALRTTVDAEGSFRDLLRRVREMALGAYAHQDLPFERLVQELRPGRDTSRAPLVQVLFNVVNAPLPPATGTLTSQPFPIDRGAAQFDLTLSVNFERQRTALLEYDTDLFDAHRIDRMLAQYRTILEEVVRDPDRPVAGIPLLDRAERQTVLVDWNATAAECPAETVAQRFEAAAARTPGARAVRCGADEIDYASLNKRANRIARHLRACGAGPGRFVGLCMERSIDLVAGLLAIVKSGAAYLPLDPAFPRDRLAFMLEDSAAPVLLTAGPAAGDLPPTTARVVRLDADRAAIAAQSADNLEPSAGPEDPVYVIYTSGSTGKPKGVVVPHRALTNFLWSMQREPGLTDRDTVVAVTTLSFDIAGLEIHLPLVTGARVVLATRDEATDPVRLAALMQVQGAALMQATPATWRMLLDDGWTGRPDLTILCGGEAMTRDLADRLLVRGRAVWNMYGPTETTVWSTIERVSAGTEPISIGRPIANTQVYVLDPRGQPVPIGVPGELHIGGEGVATGYLNRPDLTAARFVPDPFSGRPGARLYRTGDLARWRADGRLDCIGRADHQVKIRGFRIELGEIESVLTALPAVREAVAVVREDRQGDKRLAAYVVCHRGRERDGQRNAPASESVAARLHGAVVLHGAGHAAAHGEREGGPQGAAGSDGWSGCRHPGGAATHRHRTAGRGHLDGGSWCSGREREGQFLRYRRPFTALDAGNRADRTRDGDSLAAARHDHGHSRADCGTLRE